MFWVLVFVLFFFLVTFPLIASPLHSLKRREKTPHILTTRDEREIEDRFVKF